MTEWYSILPVLLYIELIIGSVLWANWLNLNVLRYGRILSSCSVNPSSVFSFRSLRSPFCDISYIYRGSDSSMAYLTRQRVNNPEDGMTYFTITPTINHRIQGAIEKYQVLGPRIEAVQQLRRIAFNGANEQNYHTGCIANEQRAKYKCHSLGEFSFAGHSWGERIVVLLLWNDPSMMSPCFTENEEVHKSCYSVARADNCEANQVNNAIRNSSKSHAR